VCASERRDVVARALDAGADDAVHLSSESTMSQLVDATTMSGYNRIDVAFVLAGDRTSMAVAVRSLHRGGTLYELTGTTQCSDELTKTRYSEGLSTSQRRYSEGLISPQRQCFDALTLSEIQQTTSTQCCDELIKTQRFHELSTQQRQHSERLTTSQRLCSDALTLGEVVRRGVTLKPVLAGSLEQLRELVDVLAVQRVNVDNNIPVELCRPDQLASAVQRLAERTATGRIVVEYD